MKGNSEHPKIGYRETMRAIQSPDVYAGQNCDSHEPRWVGSADGDKEGAGPLSGTLSFDASAFPPGTKIVIFEPKCPRCGETPYDYGDSRYGEVWERTWRCACDFDWREWSTTEFA